MAKTKKPTHIDLAPQDAAFVMKADGGQEIYMPDMDPDATVAPHVELATMLAFVITDEPIRNKVHSAWLGFVERNGREDVPNVASSPDYQPGTLVEAIKSLDPDGAKVEPGARGVVFHEKNFYKDGAGPCVMWMTGSMCSIYDGDTKIIREVNC